MAKKDLASAAADATKGMFTSKEDVKQEPEKKPRAKKPAAKAC